MTPISAGFSRRAMRRSTPPLRRSAAAGLPPIQVAPNQGKLLQLLARLIGARRILEIGTLGGYSTIWLARALPPDGALITLEADAKTCRGRPRQFFARRRRSTRSSCASGSRWTR